MFQGTVLPFYGKVPPFFLGARGGALAAFFQRSRRSSERSVENLGPQRPPIEPLHSHLVALRSAVLRGREPLHELEWSGGLSDASPGAGGQVSDHVD